MKTVMAILAGLVLVAIVWLAPLAYCELMDTVTGTDESVDDGFVTVDGTAAISSNDLQNLRLIESYSGGGSIEIMKATPVIANYDYTNLHVFAEECETQGVVFLVESKTATNSYIVKDGKFVKKGG